MTFIALATTLLSLTQQGQADVRVLNAVVDRDTLTIQTGDAVWQSIPYGQRTNYASVTAGNVFTLVTGWNQEKIANEVMVKLQAGYPHTLIFTGEVTKSGKFSPLVFRDSTAGPPAGNAQFQFMNALTDKQKITWVINGQKLRQGTNQAAGEQSVWLSYAQRDYDISMVDSSGTELFKTSVSARAKVRYYVVALGAKEQKGNRAPRIFTYQF